MKRAVELFTLEARSSRSPLVAQTWQARSEPEESFISVAATHWEMVVTRQRGAARLTVRGPETRATAVPIPQDAEFFGIEFSAGTFMPDLPPGRLVDRTVTLPQVSDRSFWLDGSAWELPGPDNADVFVARLARGPAGARPDRGRGPARRGCGLVHPVGGATGGAGTGLTRGAIGRIRRAERAVELLSRGAPPSDVAPPDRLRRPVHLTGRSGAWSGRHRRRSAVRGGQVGGWLSLAFKTAVRRRARPQPMRQLINSTYITLDGVVEARTCGPR